MGRGKSPHELVLSSLQLRPRKLASPEAWLPRIVRLQAGSMHSPGGVNTTLGRAPRMSEKPRRKMWKVVWCHWRWAGSGNHPGWKRVKGMGQDPGDSSSRKDLGGYKVLACQERTLPDKIWGEYCAYFLKKEHA